MVFCTGSSSSPKSTSSLSSYGGRRSSLLDPDARESVASIHRVVLPHGDPIFRSGWLRVRFKPLGRSVPRFCTLTGACFKHSATPSGEILSDGFDIFGAKVSSDDFSSHAIIVRPVGGSRITLIAESRADLGPWLRDLTRASYRAIGKDYQFVRELRPAGVGKTLLALDRGNETAVGVKLTSKRVLSPRYIALARAEAVTLLSLANHPNILAIRDVYESARNIYLVTEYVGGHTLAELMVMRGSVGEADVAVILRDLFSALEHMHLAGAVHRLCSPDNVLLIYGDSVHKPIVGAKLCNLEFTANVFDLQNAPPMVNMFERDGPLDEDEHASYIAPEVVRGELGTCAQDMWGMGALMQYMLTGTTPYTELAPAPASSKTTSTSKSGEEIKEKLEIIARGERPKVVGPRWRGVTTGARQLCARLLDPDPGTRITATQALEDAWITLK